METKVNFNVLDVIEKVYQHSKDSLLRKDLFDILKPELNLLEDYFQINDIQCIIFSNGFILGFEETSLSKIFKYFGLEEYKIMKYKKDIDLLFEKGLFKENQKHKRGTNFEISKSVMNAITENIRFQNSFDIEKRDFISVLEKFDSYSDMYDDDLIINSELRYKINNLLEEHCDLPFIKLILGWKLDFFESFFFLDVLWDAIKAGDNDFNTGIQSTIDDFYKNRSKSINALNKVLNKETKLNTLKLIEISKEEYKNHTKAKLSKNIIQLLKEKEDIILDFGENKTQKFIYAEKIQEKTLFYGESEKPQIETVYQMLMNNKLVSIQERLKEKAMPIGVTVLLYGVPGTGKTESVYQLARQTGRNIMKVDISETKSMWFGESQKLAKKIFTDYKELKENEETCPILLLNEADAIIGKRKAVGNNNIADTENAIQNIFLEELENFDGILFATTNLVKNMDNAFERRFLYKIQFQKPTMEQSHQIWKSKLSFLSYNECENLTKLFDFSGGEMENIARKLLTNEILTGEKPNFEHVKNLCENEKWSKKENVKIGF